MTPSFMAGMACGALLGGGVMTIVMGFMAEAGLRKRDERIKRLKGLLRRAAVWLGCLANEHPKLRRPRELRDAICEALNMPNASVDKPSKGR